MESSDQFAKTGSGQRQRRIQTATVFRPFFDRFRPFFDRFLWHSASAAFAFRTIPHLDGVVDILSWWTFTDVFEEGGAKESPFLRYLYIKPIILPRQARDKYRESTQTEWRFAQACRPRSTRISVSWLLKARLLIILYGRLLALLSAVCCLLAASCCVLPTAYCLLSTDNSQLTVAWPWPFVLSSDGLMTYHGVPKPGWRGFQLLAEAGDHRVAATIGSSSSSSSSSSSLDSTGLGSAASAPMLGECVTEPGTEMAGFTLSSVKADTEAYCCAKCQAVDQQHCSFWTFHNVSAVYRQVP